MHKIFLCITFFLNISFCSFDKSDAFSYSIKNLEFQNSVYSFKITKSQLNSFDYTFCWAPTKQILISSNLINVSNNCDIKLYHGMNVGFFFLKHNIISIGINSLNFDNEHTHQKWNNYCLINEFDFYDWRVNTTLAYNFNKNFSFTNISFYIYNNIYKNFDIGFGTNISNFSSLMTNIYIGIKYKL